MVAVATTLSAGGGIEEDELRCEEAVAQVADCCPDIALDRIGCVSDGCSKQSTFFGPSESDCLRNASCEEFNDGDICARVADRLAASYAEPQRTQVCP
jgi:hypothetical protein